MGGLRIGAVALTAALLAGCGRTPGAAPTSPDQPSASAASSTKPTYAPILGAQPVYREIDDWVVACDNTHECFGKYVEAGDGPGGRGYLSIDRGAGSDGRLEVAIQGDLDNNTLPDPTGPRLDGKALSGYEWKINAKDGTQTLDGDAALRFLRAILGGKTLAYSDAKDGPFVSLNGMKAALQAIDDDQGRTGNQTALVGSGPAPASALAANPPEPTVYASPMRFDLPGPAPFAAAVRRSQAELLKRHDCEPSQAVEDEAHALDADTALVILGCIHAAYQGTVLVFTAPRGAPDQARQLFLPLQPRLDPSDIPNSDGEYVEGAWDAKTATFSETGKGRGIGDCGASSAWTYDGNRFVLTAYNALIRCGGGPAGDWPTVYRTSVVVR